MVPTAYTENWRAGSLVGATETGREALMDDTLTFGLFVLCSAGAGLLAVQSQALSQWLRIPAPALFLTAAALAAEVIPGLPDPSQQSVERVVTLALIVILFDGA